MNFVDHLNIFGVEAKEIPSITGSGAPTTATEGAVGCLYMDSDTGELYKCTAAAAENYTWEIFGGGGNTGEAAGTSVCSLDELKRAIANGSKNIELGASFEVGEQVSLPNGTCLNGCNYTITRSTGYEGTLFALGSNCRIKAITINGNRENMVSPTWDKTKEIATSSDCVVEDVTIENGNEAIIVYGCDVVVRNCKVTNCGGNGVHFSGANRSRVENCVIINSNLKAGMGHEDGGIIWSDQCCDTVVENNYVENAKCAFGSIDADHNSSIKIIGNTARNCLKAVAGIFQASIPTNLIVSNNQFVDCVEFQINRVDGGETSEVNWIISNNLFDNTKLYLVRVAHCVICGNVFKNAPSYHALETSKHLTITGNHFSRANATPLLYLPNNSFITFEGNTAVLTSDADTSNTVFNIQGTSVGYVVKGNVFEVNSDKHTGKVVQFMGGGDICEGNRISIKSGTGIAVGSNMNCSNNVIICASAEQQAILAYGGCVNTVIANNLSNGTFKINSSNVTNVNNMACAGLEFATE